MDSKDERIICPFCNNDNTIPYLYGEPTYEAFEKSEKGILK